jgi:quinol monooxygenase YgiN
MKNLVIVGFPAKKEKFEELKKTLKVALVDTRAFEGCISIDTYEDISTNTIFLIEDWESLDNHANYANWRAETGLADILEPLLDGGAASLKIIRCGEKLDI